MKKLFFSIIAILPAVVLNAQDSLGNSGYLSLTAGCSFPLAGSRLTTLINGGLAKSRFTVESGYAHQFDELFGFKSVFVYNRFPINHSSSTESSVSSIKPWEYYQFLIGPMMSGAVSSKAFLDVSVLSGVAYINASKVNVDGKLIEKKYSTSAVPLKFIVDFRFVLSSKFYLLTEIHYNYMRANFNVTVESQELSFKQRMNSIGVNAGIGLDFY